MKTKICGITRRDDLTICEQEDVDLIGFINIPRSPRYVKLNEICDLASSMDNRNKAVLVTESDDTSEIQRAIDETGISFVQLHSLDINGIREIQRNNPEIKIIKAVGISETMDDHKIREIESYSKICQYLIFDSEIKGRSGGTGKQIPLNLAVKASEIASKNDKGLKLILAGGINANRMKDEGKMLEKYFQYVDVNSGVEEGPGVKSKAKIKEFLEVMK